MSRKSKQVNKVATTLDFLGKYMQITRWEINTSKIQKKSSAVLEKNRKQNDFSIKVVVSF